MGNRLTRAVTGAPLESYSYDAVSNHLSTVTAGAVVRTITYSPSGNTATDDDGLGTVLTQLYDSTDRLGEVKQGVTTLATYLHNAAGQRVAKTVGGATTHYLYDLSGNLIAEHDGATGAPQAEYAGMEGMKLAYIQGGMVYWVHGDQLDTPQRLTDATKAVVWDASYAPFGEAAVTGALTFNQRFPGQYYDAETGLHYNYFRDYDSMTGRYIQSDPIGLRGGWNTYAYVGGNPVMLVDPSGLVFGVPGFLESFSLGASAAGSGFAVGMDVSARNCCGEDGHEYLEFVGVQTYGISAGASYKLAGGRGQSIGLLSFIIGNSGVSGAGLPQCSSGGPVPPSLTINFGFFSGTVSTAGGESRIDVGVGFGEGVSVTLNLFTYEYVLGKIEIGECCNK